MFRNTGESRVYAIILIIMFSLLPASCATTTSLSSVWMDETYQGGPVQSVLVLGVMQPGEMQIAVEDELVQMLQTRGVRAVASHTLFPGDTLPEKEEIEQKTKELKADTVLVVRFVEIDDMDMYLTYPPYLNTNQYGYYSLCCQTIISSGYHVRFETTIFDAENNKVIWSALSDTELERKRETITESYTHAVLGNLYKMRLVR